MSGGVSPSAKSQRRRAGRDGEVEDAATRAARRAAWRAARLRSLEQVSDYELSKCVLPKLHAKW